MRKAPEIALLIVSLVGCSGHGSDGAGANSSGGVNSNASGGVSSNTSGGASGSASGHASGGVSADASGGSGSDANGGTTGSTGGVPTSTTGGAQGSFPKACSDIYDPELVPVFELTIAPSDLASMEDDCVNEIKQYRPATFRYGDETADVMVRLKGNWSFRCEKKQFVISFNETDSKARFHGQRKIVLDAPWYDPSLLAERLGFSFMKRAGNFWSCVNNARLELNGEYYGAYVNIERLDKEYLQRHFPKADAEGNLYQAGAELTTNETLNDTSDLEALTAAGDIAAIDALVDLEEAVKVWAASAMLPDTDSYWAGVEINHYLYHHPTRGFLWLPVDMDLTMRQGELNPGSATVDFGVLPGFVEADPFQYQNADWSREPLFQAVLSDPHWCGRFLEALKSARDAYDVEAMSSELDAWAALIDEAISQDERKPYTDADHLASIATLKAFMPQRLAFVNTWLSTATCPVTGWDP